MDLNPEPFDPVIAYCEERLKALKARRGVLLASQSETELEYVIKLCEGLNRQQEMINKALKLSAPVLA